MTKALRFSLRQPILEPKKVWRCYQQEKLTFMRHAILIDPGAALSAAASEGNEKCLRVLLDHGGDSN